MIVNGTTAALGLVLAIVSYPVYLHFLGYTNYGLWVVISTFITLCQLGSLGIAPALSKLIAEEIGTNNRDGAQLYVEVAISALMVFGTLILVLLFMFRGLIIQGMALSSATSHTLHNLLPFVIALSFYAFLNDVFGAALIGVGRTDLASGIQIGSQVTGFGCSVLLLKAGLGIMALATGTLTSLILIHILTTAFSWRVSSLKLRPGIRLDWGRAQTLLRLASTVFVSSLAAAVFVPLNKLLISTYVGLAAVPVYEMAFTGSMRLRSVFEMPIRPIMPALSHALSFGTSHLRSSLRLINQRIRRVLLLAGISFGVCFLFVEPLLRMWLRRSFDPSLPVAVRLALIGAFISLLGVPAYHALLGLGRPRDLFWSHIIQSAANAAIVLFGLFFGYSISSKTVLIAGSTAMAVSTWFLMARYARALKSLGRAGDPSSPERGATLTAAVT